MLALSLLLLLSLGTVRCLQARELHGAEQQVLAQRVEAQRAELAGVQEQVRVHAWLGWPRLTSRQANMHAASHLTQAHAINGMFSFVALPYTRNPGWASCEAEVGSGFVRFQGLGVSLLPLPVRIRGTLRVHPTPCLFAIPMPVCDPHACLPTPCQTHALPPAC